jgi:uncharacterized delta-60 repeat protein
VQPDGKIVASGMSEDRLNPDGSQNYEVARYNADGSLDSSFGTGGRVTIDVRGTLDSPGVLASLNAGDFVVAGQSAETTSITSPTDVSAVRLKSDGSLDTSFADAGKFVSAFGGPVAQAAFAVAGDGSGRPVLAGVYGADFLLLRLLSSGPDPTFGDGGVVTTDFAGRADQARAVLVQGDGRLLAAGTSGMGAQADTYGMSLARYLPSGAADTTFGTSGATFIAPPPNAQLGIHAAAFSGACGVVTVDTWFYDVNAVVTHNAIGVARFRR